MLQYVDIPQMAAAFKKQVVCDFKFLKRLFADTETNTSHKAHILQMCFEKFAKYYQLKMGNQINKQHNWVERVIPHLFEERYGNVYSYTGMKKLIPVVRSFCKEIDLLAPAHYGIDKQNPVNCEYPWEVTDIKGGKPRMFAPCEYHFSIFDDRYLTITRKILTIVEEQIQ